MKKHFKLVLSDLNKAIWVILPLVPLPSEVDLILKKKYSKKYAFEAFSFSGNKMILILLTKVIIFHIGFDIIYI